MDFVDVITNENSPKPIQSEVEFEKKIIIEAAEWEEEVKGEIKNVQSVNVLKVKVEGSDNEKESALYLSKSSLEIESMIVKTEEISESTYLSTNNFNFAFLVFIVLYRLSKVK